MIRAFLWRLYYANTLQLLETLFSPANTGSLQKKYNLFMCLLYIINTFSTNSAVSNIKRFLWNIIKAVLLFNLIILIPHIGVTQNLVPNPSFEDYSLCPVGSNQVNRCLNWQNFGNSPDYWGSCGPTGTTLPNIPYGYQYPHSGQNLMGLVLISKDTSAGQYREFIGVEMSSPTIVGQKYYLSFYCNNTWNFGIACNNMGMKFSTVGFDSCCPAPLTNMVHLKSDSIIVDSLNWTYVSGSFVADSVYTYLMLGNFFETSQTDTLWLLSAFSSNVSYYYFDDICVTTDSLYNLNWTSVPENENVIFTVFPNPTFDEINISSLNIIDEYQLFNMEGQLLVHGEVHESKLKINLDDYSSGILILSLKVKGVWHKTKVLHII